MKIWIIERNELNYKYLISVEKSIWITEHPKNLDINELIKNKNLGIVKSFRYEQLKEIVLIDTDSTILFVFKDKNTEKEKFLINKNVFGDIRNFLKTNLSGINVKNYSVIKQVLPQLSTLGLGIIFIALVYQTAVDLENGIKILEGRKSSIIKKIIFHLAEIIGVYGSIAFGTIFILVLIFLINRKLQNPKKGEVFTFGKFVILKNGK